MIQLRGRILFGEQAPLGIRLDRIGLGIVGNLVGADPLAVDPGIGVLREDVAGFTAYELTTIGGDRVGTECEEFLANRFTLERA